MYCKIRNEIKENPKVKLKIPKNLLPINFKLTSQASQANSYEVSCDVLKYANLVGYIINQVTLRFLWLTLCLNARSVSLPRLFVCLFLFGALFFCLMSLFFFHFIFALILSLAWSKQKCSRFSAGVNRARLLLFVDFVLQLQPLLQVGWKPENETKKESENKIEKSWKSRVRKLHIWLCGNYH